MMLTSFTSKLFNEMRCILKRGRKPSGIALGLALILLFLLTRYMLSGPAHASATLLHRSAPALPEKSSAPTKLLVNSDIHNWLNKPKAAPSRNLFTLNLDNYTMNGVPQQRHDQQAVSRHQLQAGKLVLQDTIMGTPPKAIVNGELLKEGDIIAGFMLTRIFPRKILIQQDDITLEIAMP